MRTERVEFLLDCEYEQAKQFTKRLRDFGFIIPDIDDGDLLKLRYQLNIDYLGRVSEVLQTFVEIIESGAVVKGDLVGDGEILIKRILESLQRIRN